MKPKLFKLVELMAIFTEGLSRKEVWEKWSEIAAARRLCAVTATKTYGRFKGLLKVREPHHVDPKLHHP